ncbi:hypothetical protein D9611_006550 [Ephemerocybe angulata]|uniref:Uncharacterized protein n=1 Tax=Ephemerocybe angulata TaxID=980116 RepID=A0A8H5C9A8_9AGAR|nr:hypothetical protein D9611_006550 [Tulosesus angulatus]
MSTQGCRIPGNPDIAGVGVRCAIYVQTLLCFFPAFWTLGDGKVTRDELDSAETQATTNLVLAFAILVSSIVQAQTLVLTNYHASIVLSMSWLNNTNAFIYFLLYVQHKNQPNSLRPVDATWSGWYHHFRSLIAPILPGAPEHVDIEEVGTRGAPLPPIRRGTAESDASSSITKRRKAAKILVKRFVLLLGSLHLTLMASLGLWLWSDIRGFGKRSDEENACAAQLALFAILGKYVPFASGALRITSFIIYGIFLIPGFNLLLPIAVFLGIYTLCHYLPNPALLAPEQLDASQAPRSSVFRSRAGKARNFVAREIEWGMLPPFLGLLFLLSINIVFITDIELTLKRNAGLQLVTTNEGKWEFGQILSMLLLILPLRDLAETILARRTKQRQKVLIPGLRTAFKCKEWRTVSDLVKMGADPNVIDGDTDMSAIQAACLSDDSVPGFVIIAMLEAGGDPNIETDPLNRDKHSIDRDIKDCLRLLRSVEKRPQDAAAALRVASTHGYGAAVVLLLGSYKLDVNSTNKTEETALILASQGGHRVIAEVLCKEPGIELNLRDSNGRTALMRASANGHKLIVSTLLSSPSCNMYLADKDGQTAIAYATTGGHREVVALFKPTFTARGRRSPLIQATIDNDEDTVVGLLTWPGIDINAKDQDGKTAIMWASQLGHVAIVKLLCAAAGIQVNISDGEGRTALMLASSKILHSESTIELLCSTPGIDLNQADNSGKTALIWAASQLGGAGSELATKCLCAAREIDVNVADNDGATALMWASSQGNEATVKVLCATPGIDVNRVDINGTTPLMSASIMAHEDVVQILCRTPGIDVNMVNIDGRTALMMATFSGDDRSRSLVETLCSVPGIDVNIADEEGKTALFWAASEDNEAVVEVLCAAPGIDVNLADSDGTTALMQALAWGHDAVVEILRTIPGIIEPGS